MKPRPSLVTLPVEIKLQILRFLDRRDLRSIVRVCRAWRSVGQDPGLWRHAHLTLTARTLPDLATILATPRLKLLAWVKFEQNIAAKNAEDTLRLILRHGSITTLNVSGSKLSSVSGPTLQSLVRKVRTLWVQNCRFVESQLNEVFSVIGSGGSSLDTLYISNNRLTGLRAELLRAAVTRLRCLHCDNTDLGRGQLSDMLSAVREAAAGESRLEELNLMMNRMTHISHQLVSTSLARLVSVNLYGCDPILLSLLQSLQDAASPSLRHLDLGYNDLTVYRAPLLADAVLQLVSVKMREAMMTPMQISMLLTNIATKDTFRLKHLEMSQGSHVPNEELISQAKLKLETFEIHGSVLF